HLTVSPAALESSTAFTGIVVGCYVQHVFSGFAEGGSGGGLSAERGLGILAVYFFDLGPVLGESDAGGSAVPDPPYGHRGRAGFGLEARRRSVLSVIGDPHRQCQRRSHL